MKRWNEYIRELYDGIREELTEESNLEGPSILKEEVTDAVNHMKKEKQNTQADGITIEELEVLREFGVDILIKMLNDIYISGYLPSDKLKSVFIAIPKRSGAIECEDFRTINIINHVTKRLLRIIMRR